MLNHVDLHGYIAFDVVGKKTASGKDYVMNSINVRRNYKDSSGKYGYDSIPFMIFGQSATNFTRFCKKGDTVVLYGNLQSTLETWDVIQDGAKKERKMNMVKVIVEGFDLMPKPQTAQPDPYSASDLPY